tara:strand:+ start:1381 stop:1596 length:216 start_codon:yes stop_codon:yes gene_type:complete
MALNNMPTELSMLIQDFIRPTPAQLEWSKVQWELNKLAAGMREMLWDGYEPLEGEGMAQMMIFALSGDRAQ